MKWIEVLPLPLGCMVTAGLNAREQQLLTFIAEGCNQDTTAEKMKITRATVRWYLTQLYDRFEVTNTAELIAYCITKQLVVVAKHST